jgi:hypothetical protein
LYLRLCAEGTPKGQEFDQVRATEMAQISQDFDQVSRSENNQSKFLVGDLPKSDSEKRTDRHPSKGRQRLIVAVFS